MLYMSFEIKNVFLLYKIKDRNIFYNRSSVNTVIVLIS